MSLDCYCDYPYPEFVRETDRKARVPHKCCECGATISPGNDYRVIAGCWGGQFNTFKQCEACADLWDSMADLGFCLEYGNLRQDHQDYLEVYEPPRLP